MQRPTLSFMALTSVSGIPGRAQGKAKQRRDHSKQERKLMKDMAGPALHTYWRDLFWEDPWEA